MTNNTILRMTAVMAVVLFSLLSAAYADENTSWLADDMLDTYHEGTLAFLDDPSGRGLSVYDNYVFRVEGDTFLRSSWKTPTNLPPDRSWAWGSGSPGTWVLGGNGTFIGYTLSTPPTYIYLGTTPVSYLEYSRSSMYRQANQLWIQGQDSWTSRVVAPAGSYVWLLAYTPSAGNADLYKISPDGMVTVETQMLPSGYSHMAFYGENEGRYMISFVKDNQPSNSIIVDVITSSFVALGNQPNSTPSVGA